MWEIILRCVLLLNLILFVHSEVEMMSVKINDTTQKVICTASDIDVDAALMFIKNDDGAITVLKHEMVNRKSELDCKNILNCFSITNTTDWVMETSFKPLNDIYFEDLDIINSSLNLTLLPESYSLNREELWFSVSGQGNVALCEKNKLIIGNKCLWIELNFKKGNDSIASECRMASPNAALNHFDNCSIVSIKNKINDANNLEWNTYAISYKSNYWYIKNEEGSILMSHEGNATLTPKYVFVSSLNNALWRIHRCSYLKTVFDDIYLEGPTFNLISQKICISIDVMLCEICRLELTLERNNYTHTEIINTTHSKWHIEKFIFNFPEYINGPVFIKLKTISNYNSSGNWGVRSLRECIEKNDTRTIQAITSIDAKIICKRIESKHMIGQYNTVTAKKGYFNFYYLLLILLLIPILVVVIYICKTKIDICGKQTKRKPVRRNYRVISESASQKTIPHCQCENPTVDHVYEEPIKVPEGSRVYLKVLPDLK